MGTGLTMAAGCGASLVRQPKLRGGRAKLLLLSIAVPVLLATACAGPRPQTAARSAAVGANACDALAANPRDKAKVGAGVPTDDLVPARAIPACRAAVMVNPGAPRLMYQLGRALDVAGEYDEAASWYRKAAQAGHAVAQTSLGSMYEFGEGVEQSDAEAFSWYSRAAKSGDPWANSSLALLHQEGRTVPTNRAEALRLYRLGSAGGDSWADVQIGLIYERGEGVPANAGEAARWYRKAAEGGEPTGQYNLGVLYETGKGVRRDDAEAARWYRRAADQGNALAQHNLAMLHREGRGVRRDDAEAVRLWQASAAQGQWQAQNALADHYAERGQNLDEALELAQQALEQEPDNADVLDTYGWVLHRLGRDVEAATQIERAAQGNPQDPAVVRAHLGDVYAALGRTEEAQQQWQQALELASDEDLAGNLRQKLGLGPASAQQSS